MPIDYKEYPPNWKTEIRPAILKRAENKCEDCGAPNHAIIYRPHKGKSDWKLFQEGMEAEAMSLDGIKATKIILTIAHLDHDKRNHDISMDRLKALCQRCHLRYDMNHHKDNRRYGRHWKRDQTSMNL